MKINISPKVAQWLVRKIPLLYPNEPAFGYSLKEYMKEAKSIKQKTIQRSLIRKVLRKPKVKKRRRRFFV
ncbi:MAG: hypothetical protein NTY48_05345 [Candidatus Diapherotrites archaeon]|nr:hypothetical protein [Candidatus Diapherotrites archaeon]